MTSSRNAPGGGAGSDPQSGYNEGPDLEAGGEQPKKPSIATAFRHDPCSTGATAVGGVALLGGIASIATEPDSQSNVVSGVSAMIGGGIGAGYGLDGVIKKHKEQVSEYNQPASGDHNLSPVGAPPAASGADGDQTANVNVSAPDPVVLPDDDDHVYDASGQFTTEGFNASLFARDGAGGYASDASVSAPDPAFFSAVDPGSSFYGGGYPSGSSETYYFRDGYDDDGFDLEGFDFNGVNRDGYDRYGRFYPDLAGR